MGLNLKAYTDEVVTKIRTTFNEDGAFNLLITTGDDYELEEFRTPVWVVADDPANIKVFKEKNDAIDYADIYDLTVVETELVWVEQPPFPPRSKYICTKCGISRPKWFDLCNNNIRIVDKAWCDICQEDTGFKKEQE